MNASRAIDWYASTRDEADKVADAASQRSGEEWKAVDCSFQFTERWAVRRATDGKTMSNGDVRWLRYGDVQWLK